MSRKLVEYVWCDGVKLAVGDWAMRHEPETETGDPRVLLLDPGKPKIVDLCDPCNEQMTLAEARICAREFGVVAETAGKVPKPANPLTTPAGIVERYRITGERVGKPPNGTRNELCLWCPMDYTTAGLLSHVKKHGFNGTKEAFGSQCPACGKGGFDVLSVHISRSHPEFAGTTQAFIWARDNNDPYGVYSVRRAAGQNVVEALPS